VPYQLVLSMEQCFGSLKSVLFHISLISIAKRGTISTVIVLGIDPGTAKMGYGIVEIKRNKPRLVETNDIITPAGMDMHKRLRIIYRGLNGLIKEYAPHVMVIERLFFNTNVKTAMTVGQARGVALLASTNKKMDVYEYTALEAKKMIAGHGRADKKVMQQAVKEMLGLTERVKSDDANDAVAMALCFYKKDFEDLK
jgi:crossover junction endodeoxyribonuclease RuvC